MESSKEMSSAAPVPVASVTPVAPAYERIELVIDGQNFYYLQKQGLEWFIDPSRLLDYIDEEIGKCENMTYYHRTVGDGQNAEENYLRALVHMGFHVDINPDRTYFNQHGKGGSLTAKICTDIGFRHNNYDHLVIVSGDGDLLHAIMKLHAMNKRYTVLSTKKFISHEMLAFLGNNFIDFEEIRADVEKKPN